MKVLIVDDDPISVMSVRLRLEKLGHVVVSHDQGFGTVAIVEKERPDIVLLDVQMPGVTGHALADAITRSKLPVRLILHSADPNSVTPAHVKRCGAHGGLVKTSDPAAFASAFRALAQGPLKF
jgi:DNA-binding NarL/FixJ family response regulator